MLISSELILLTTTPPFFFFFRLLVTKTNRHITARIEHIKGNIVVQASTKEWAIKKHLYSTSDVSASENLGRVLADRCLESGINFVHNSMKKTDKEQEGVCLSHQLILWHNYVLTCAFIICIYLFLSLFCTLFAFLLFIYQSNFFLFTMKKNVALYPTLWCFINENIKSFHSINYFLCIIFLGLIDIFLFICFFWWSRLIAMMTIPFQSSVGAVRSLMTLICLDFMRSLVVAFTI